MLTITSILAMFVLLIICSFTFFISKKVNLPYTVSLVIVGIVVAILSSSQTLAPIFGFLTQFQLTPELLFYIFLPTLIFESAFAMNMRNILDNVWSISILSVIGLLVSALCISGLLFFLFPLIGLNIPFIILFLFAAIISATDPVAVLALFKEYGAPKRLTLIFEGESLFNDGTAVALFLVVLGIATSGYHGLDTITHGTLTFLSMIFVGILFGLFLALVFTRVLKYTRENEFVSITLLIVSAHIVFILSELINQNGIFGLPIHISPIIATTIAALFLGNYSRHILSPKSDEYIEKSISHLAFIINSLVFILIGTLFATSNINLSELILPITLTIIVVAFARAVSIYSTVIPLNKLKLEEDIPLTWQHLLSWGSLRGALAIIIVLLIPDSLTVSGWNMATTPKEFLIALTTGCIMATLLVKATTIKWFMNKFNTYDENPLQKINNAYINLFITLNQKIKSLEFVNKGFIFTNTKTNIQTLEQEVEIKINQIKLEIHNLEKQYDNKYFLSALHTLAIDIEEKYLKDLYNNSELDEKVYRRLKNKLTIQKEKIEKILSEEINASTYTDKKDVFEKFITFLKNPFSKNRDTFTSEEQIEYYRAQTIIARKVIKNLEDVQKIQGTPIFNDNIFTQVLAIYKTYKTQSESKMLSLIEKHPHLLSFVEKFNQLAIAQASHKSLEYLSDKGFKIPH